MKQMIAAFFTNLGIASFVGFGGSKAKTVDGVLLTFTKTLDALKEVQAQEIAAADKFNSDRLSAQLAYETALSAAIIGQNAAEAEATRAAVAVDRFSKLVEGI